MFVDHDINRLRMGVEGQYFDRKSARIRPKQILKDLVGFANASGGVLVIGVEDGGELTGFLHSGSVSMEQFLEAPQSMLRNTPISLSHSEIPITNSKGEADNLLLFDVQVSTNHVVECYDGEVYLRVNDRTIRLSYEQRKQLQKIVVRKLM